MRVRMTEASASLVSDVSGATDWAIWPGTVPVVVETVVAVTVEAVVETVVVTVVETLLVVAVEQVVVALVAPTGV